jgi:hypothetical protein
MKKLQQPFGEFGNSLSVSISGADLRTENGKRTLGIVYGEIARFILACRAVPANQQQYDGKSISRPLWSGNYSKIGAMEYLKVQLRGGVPPKPKPKKEPKPTDDPLCLLILHGTNKITATRMDSLGPGSVGAVVYSKTLGAADFTPVTDEWGWSNKQRTVQMKNVPELGSIAVSPFKYANNTIRYDVKFQVWQMTRSAIIAAETGMPSGIYNAYPSLNAVGGTIYACGQSFSVGTGGLTLINPDTFGFSPDPSGGVGYPAWIDANLRAYSYVQYETINELGSATFIDANLAPGPPYDVNQVQRRTAGGGFSYAGLTFPRPYMTQDEGLDTLHTVEFADNSIIEEDVEYGYKVTFILDGVTIDDIRPGEVALVSLGALSFPYATSNKVNDHAWYRYNPGGVGTFEGIYGPERAAADYSFMIGRCTVSNGEHRLAGWFEDTISGEPSNSEFWMDGADCTSSLEDAIKGSADTVVGAFMDVPFSVITSLA